MPRLRLLNVVRALGLLVLLVQLGGCNICGKFFRDAEDIVGLAVSPLSGSVQPSTTQQFMATGTYSDNSTGDVTAQTEWTSSNPADRDDQQRGPGYGGRLWKYNHLRQLPVLRGQYQPGGQQPGGDHYLDCGYSRHCDHRDRQHATVCGDCNLLEQHHATSSPPRQPGPPATTTIATVTSAGLATGVASGSATITATSGSVSGTASLTVQ